MSSKKGREFLQQKAAALRDDAETFYTYSPGATVKQYNAYLNAVVASSPKTTEEEIIALIKWIDGLRKCTTCVLAQTAVLMAQTPLLAKLEKLSRDGQEC